MMSSDAPSSPLLLAAMAVSGSGPVLPANSRYQGVPTRTITLPDGRPVTFFARRLVPQPEGFSVLQQHVFAAGERLDIVASQGLGDPLLYWRICDAGRAVDPHELEAVGRKLPLALPLGVMGATSA